MRLLLDTHLILWASSDSPRLSRRARDLIEDMRNEVVFSVASLWEIAIKAALGRRNFQVEGSQIRDALLQAGYTELAISGSHALFTSQLPAIHKDPFDRLLVAQAMVEGLTLVTGDATVARYSPAIKQI